MLSLLLLLACGDDTTDDTATATDDTATTAVDDSGTTQANTAPECAVTSPPDGSFGEEGASVTFLGTATDAEQGSSSLSASWSSDKDGSLGEATPSSGGDVVLSIDDLSAATHVITLSVTDDGGELCSDFVLYTVGTPPEGTITAPASGTSYDEGEAVTFTARVDDDTTDPLELVLRWSSDLDGVLDSDPADSSGEAGFTTSELSPGEHTIEFSVTDEHGLYTVDTVTLSVNGLPTAPGISLTPADPDTTDDLVVEIEADSTDPEGDPLSYAYAWTLFGTPSSESTNARLPAEATTRGDTWTVTVTASDGASESDAAEASVTVGNAPPQLTGATITPNPASADDTLTCTGSGFFDADGDSDASTWAWSIDGTVIGTSATQTGGFGGGDTLTCEITPHDGIDAGTAVSAVATIGNTAPSISVVSISPNPAETGDTLTCSWSGYTDADGDADESFATWTVNGSTAGSGTTLSSGFVGTDEVTCTVTPFDGSSTGTPVDASLTITNAVPSLSAASITPDPAVAGDTLVCTTSGWSDADGHSDQSTWSWTVNGTEADTTASLSAGFVGGDLVACEVTPYDGADSGTPVSDSLTISNSAPSITDVTIDPNPAVAGDTLTCAWTFEDPDGDTDQSTVAWAVNGTTVATSATLSTSLSDGDLVRCTVTPDDGTDTGTAASASLTVSNSAPSITTVTILPSDPTAEDSLTCTWSGYSDADGDPDASTLLWTVDGSATGTSTTLSSGYVGGDEVTCTVTPSDGSSTGTSVSDTVTIGNTPPVLEEVTLTPVDPDASDTLTCTPGTTTDADGTTSFTYSYAWAIDGSTTSDTGSTLSGAFAKGETVTCSVTPSDGDDEGSAVTSEGVTVVNSPPEVTGIAFSDTTPATEDVLSATVSTTDLDGDSVSLSYTWYVDGTEVSGATTSSLDGADHFDKDQSIVLEVVPSDGSDDGDTATSDTLTVANTPPYAPTVLITPADPEEGADDLYCEVTGESEDLDGDTVTYSAVWTVDGSLWTGSTSTTTWTDDTIDASDTLEGEVWECSMTPDDGDDDGDPASDDVTIATGTCTTLISSVDYPVQYRSYGNTQGQWFSDPLETLGSGLHWSMNGYSSGSTVYEYTSLSNFQSDSYSRSFSLASSWEGTGAIAYGGYLYYIQYNTNTMTKVDISTGSAVATATLSGAGYHNQCPWQWGGYSDIDFEADENGLWVIYGEYASSCNLTVARIDEDLNILATYSTNAGHRGNYGNAWMVDGILYVTASYSSGTTTISYAYDTCDGSDWNPGTTFYNDGGYNSQVTYNPNDQLLYSWDSSRQYQYTVSF